MNLTSMEWTLLAVAVLLLASVLASKVSDRLGIPSLLIFLGIGMLAGSDGIGGIHFDDPSLAQTLGIIALSYILFAGGLSTGWTSVRPILWQGGLLATLGVLITAALAGWFASWIVGLPPLVGFLLGSIR